MRTLTTANVTIPTAWVSGEIAPKDWPNEELIPLAIALLGRGPQTREEAIAIVGARIALGEWAKHHAAMFVADRTDGPIVQRTKFTKGRKEGELATVRQFSRGWIMLQFFNFTYKDEFEFIVQEFKTHLGAAALADFEARLAQLPPRSDETFKRMLDEMRPAGYQSMEA